MSCPCKNALETMNQTFNACVHFDNGTIAVKYYITKGETIKYFPEHPLSVHLTNHKNLTVLSNQISKASF